MKTFTHTSHAQRILFGDGILARLGAEVDALGAARAMVLSTPGQRAEAERIASILGACCAGVFDKAAMHVPLDLVHQGRKAARDLGADCLVALGGGSTIGLAKAMTLEAGLPVLAIPTTYAGSEMTGIYGITVDGLKKTGTSARVRPRTVIYDVALTRSLPVAVSVASGINAIAHAAESFYARDTNPIMDLMAQEGIAALGRALPLLATGGTAQASAGRSEALYGAWLCGAVLGSVSMALHHKLCHTLGGSFNLPHAETHTIVLPHALAYNAKAAPQAMERIARALGGTSAAQSVFDLASGAGATMALKDIDMRGADLDRACRIAMTNPYWNPRPLEAGAIRQLLQDAFDGIRPSH